MFAKVLSISDVLMWRWYTVAEFQVGNRNCGTEDRGTCGT